MMLASLDQKRNLVIVDIKAKSRSTWEKVPKTVSNRCDITGGVRKPRQGTEFCWETDR